MFNIKNMGIFRFLYEAKKREIEMKQGKHGRKQQYLSFLAMIIFYGLYFHSREDRNNPFWWSLFGLMVLLFIFRIWRDFRKGKTNKKD